MRPEGFPQTLYKYRDWALPNHQKILLNREVYFPPASSFNDPFDCAIPFKYDERELTKENIYRKALEVIEQSQPTWTGFEKRKAAARAVEEGRVFDDKVIEQQDLQRRTDFNANFGMLSLTTQRNNFLMWSHYSNSHRGFSVGLDVDKLCDQLPGHFGPVIYCDEFPTFGLFDDSTKHFVKYAFHKSDVWAYEQEYRILRAAKFGRSVILEPETISEIIFGRNMPHETKLSLLKIAEEKFPNAWVFECATHKSKFEIVTDRIR